MEEQNDPKECRRKGYSPLFSKVNYNKEYCVEHVDFPHDSVKEKTSIEPQQFDSLTASQSGEIMKTYKVGLRVPESLLKEQNKLVIEREVLQYIKSRLRCKENFLTSGKLKNTSSDLVQKYDIAYDRCGSVNSLRDIDLELECNLEALKRLRWKNLVLTSASFKETDIPTFRDAANPSVSEISLTDYQNLAGKSLKMLCAHLNERVLNELDAVPRTRQDFIDLALKNAQKEGLNYTRAQLQNRFEIALSCITGIHSNIGRTAFYQLGMALKAYFDLREKVIDVIRTIVPSDPSSADFTDVIPVLLGYYSVPNNFKKYLAKKWNVDAQWVRNTLVGWRRKLDPFLPHEFQIESLTEAFSQGASYCKRFARTQEDVAVIGRLQKMQVLHLLPNPFVDLSPLLPNNLSENYAYLKSKLQNIRFAIEERVVNIDIDAFYRSAKELVDKVRQNQFKFEPNTLPYNNCQTFVNKVQFIVEEVSNRREFRELLKMYIVGNRFTKYVSFLFGNLKYKRLFTALRGIIALTLADKYLPAISQFLRAFEPDACLTFPFTSKSRKRSLLPVNLLFNKYVVERKAHPNSSDYLVNQRDSSKQNATDIFAKGESIWLGLPIYSPDQEQSFRDVLLGQKDTVRRKGTFWFQLKPSKKIIECVNRGAEVRDIRLNVPKGPTKKIVADVVLSADKRSVFRRSGNFLKAWNSAFDGIRVPSDDFLGVDFNRIGKHMVAVATPDQEIDISSLTSSFKKAHEKLETIRKREIPAIQRKLDKNLNKSGKLKAQITLLHQKRANISKEAKRQALMAYLYVAWKSGAKYLAWDSVGGISARGKRGALAQAITYLPKKKVLYDEFIQWAEDLKREGYLTRYEGTFPVSPFNSQVCARCFRETGEQQRTRKTTIPYDDFECTKCGHSSNRHSNSARVSALLLQHQVQSDT